MPKYSLSVALLTLFTSPEHAQSIVGDLLEEARSRGRIWFWSHIVGTTSALWWKRFGESPLALFGLAFACGTLFFLALYWGEVDDSPGLVVVGPLLAGFVCVRAAPVRGIHAAWGVALFAGTAIAVISTLSFLSVEAVAALKPAIWETVVAVGALLVGSVAARRQIVRKAARTC